MPGQSINYSQRRVVKLQKIKGILSTVQNVKFSATAAVSGCL